jgi:hypothetical protein
MSYAIMANPINTGVRRLRTLRGLWGLGTAADPDTVNELKNAGYEPDLVDTAVAMGATNEQLLALPYPADPDVESEAIATLINQLGGALPPSGAPATSAQSYPATAVPTAYGVLDLTQQSTWNMIAGLFTQTQQGIQALAQQAPGNSQVIQLVQDYNSTVNQYAGYYSDIFGSNPSPMPLVTLSGMGQAQVLIIPLAVIAGIVTILGTLYLLNQRKLAIAAQLQAEANLTSAGAQAAAAAAAQQQAANLNSQADALMAKANLLPAGAQQTTFLQQAAALRGQANALLAWAATAVATPPGATTAASSTWTAWLQSNAGLILGAVVLIAIVPPLLGRRR